LGGKLLVGNTVNVFLYIPPLLNCTLLYVETLSLPIAFVVSFVAGFVGTNAGGGAFIVVPVLIFLGLSPHIAIASMRVSIVAAAFVGLLKFGSAGKIRFEIAIPVALFSAIGAYFGANTLLQVPEDVLQKLIGLLILFALCIVYLRKDLGVVAKAKSTLSRCVGYLLFSFVGFWAAFFGGGGIFSRMIYTTFFGMTFLEAAGTAKIAVVCLSLVASFVYISAGVVDWTYTVVLILGGGTGSFLGAHYGLKKGDAWVRKLFMVVVLASALKLLM